MGNSLKDAELDVLVLQSGRNLERAARELVPEERDTDGKPLMLGPRMFRLKDQLDEETWSAYQSWAHERNAYVHGSSASIENRKSFFSNYKLVLKALESLAEEEEDDDEESITPIVLFVLLVVGVLFYAC